MAVLTGAGISAESGVPTFRGEEGLWRHYRAEDLATPSAFRRNPRLVWHRQAGSQQVLELHGDIWRARCTAGCGEQELRPAELEPLPPRCACGALLRPAVVWFGESLPLDVLEASAAAASRCQVMLVVGTSAVVQPAASLPVWAQRSGAYLIEINPEPTPLSHIADECMRQPAAMALPHLWSEWQTGQT
jgi:NAD-dependent deacetylase